MVVKVSEILKAGLDEVWEAITNPVEMRKWYFENMPDFKAEPGFETSFVMDSGDRLFTATWRVTDVLPVKQISYIWSYAEYDGEGPVKFTLTPQGGNTLLTVTNEGLESFPKDIPEFKEESCRAGWEYFLKSRLPEYFEKKNN